MSEYRVEVGVLERSCVNLAQNFKYKGTSSTNHSLCRKTRCINFSYGIRMLAEVSFVLSQFSRSTQTDGRTDRLTDCLSEDGGFIAAAR